MSERAREFLEHWVSDHVGAVADEYRMRETVRLVALCREDAIRAGIARKPKGQDFVIARSAAPAVHRHMNATAG